MAPCESDARVRVARITGSPTATRARRRPPDRRGLAQRLLGEEENACRSLLSQVEGQLGLGELLESRGSLGGDAGLMGRNRVALGDLDLDAHASGLGRGDPHADAPVSERVVDGLATASGSPATSAEPFPVRCLLPKVAVLEPCSKQATRLVLGVHPRSPSSLSPSGAIESPTPWRCRRSAWRRSTPNIGTGSASTAPGSSAGANSTRWICASSPRPGRLVHTPRLLRLSCRHASCRRPLGARRSRGSEPGVQREGPGPGRHAWPSPADVQTCGARSDVGAQPAS